MPYVEVYQELYHHGIKGQKWGIRRYQNEDGSLTDEGKKRYLKDEEFSDKGRKRYARDMAKALNRYEKVRVNDLDTADYWMRKGDIGRSALSLLAAKIDTENIAVLEENFGKSGSGANITANPIYASQRRARKWLSTAALIGAGFIPINTRRLKDMNATTFKYKVERRKKDEDKEAP